MPNTLAQSHKIVELMAPATDAAGRTSDWISLKNATKVTIVVHITQGNAATILLSLLQAKTVAAGSSKAGPAVPVWANLDTAASDTLTRGADAATYTTDAAVKNKVVVFDVDVSALDAENDFDCIAISTGASNVANITQAMAFVEMRYGGATLPSVIVD